MISLLTTLLYATLRAAGPLLLAALGGVFSERSGVVNIALDGIMLTGAFFAVYGSYTTGSALVGLALAIIAGAFMALLHAVASIHFKANQVVSGTAINLLAVGFTEFAMIRVWGGQSMPVNKVPDLGPLNIMVYVSLILAAVSWFVIYRTPWGLRLRAVGEHPRAAETVGVNVYAMRYWGVILSGVLAGLGGAALSIGLVSRFTSGMTAGRGFIGLAAMIFGNWNPLGALVACLVFGASDALATLLQIRGVNIPNEFMFMLPYVITMLALAGVVGRSTPPAADGIPYDKNH
ncbi:MAG TPA: ABC transporter permease [Symbiobacteriaceae bacterium]|nr:ABC transporter permease [Symbiobacteriaceae bacterium]